MSTKKPGETQGAMEFDIPVIVLQFLCTMKYVVCLLPLLLVPACTSGDIPVGIINPPFFYFDFTGYGEKLEPGYIKVYSDSSWDKYLGIDTVNGTAYVSTIASDSTLNYFTVSTGQYAGYRVAGQDPVIFDAPYPFLPARWPSDSTIGRSVRFTSMGSTVTVTELYTLQDTAAVATPVGTFSPTPHFLQETYVTLSGGQTLYGSQDLWAARGPGLIITLQQGGTPVYFVRGFVNGRSWDGTASVQKSARRGALAPQVGLKGPAGSSSSLLSIPSSRGRGLFVPGRI